MTEKLEYDSQLGGEVVLPDHVPTFRYAAAALREIRQLMAETKQPTGTKQIFQTLPKHMRRRAMSHNPKRLPRKYRRIHIAQTQKSGGLRTIKRPSRKYRRRPKNLLQAYLNRQRRNAWLETHIWHARRFHMIERWGYRLPHYSCDKTFRACYRATAEHCLVQDVSYFICLELKGEVTNLYEGMRRLSNKAQTVPGGLTIKANTYINGQREGFIDLFRDGEYPNGGLCRASFMWRPLKVGGELKDTNAERSLWLWLHPCVYKEVLNELLKVFELKAEVEEQMEGVEGVENVEKALAAAPQSLKKLRSDVLNKAITHVSGKIYSNPKSSTKLLDLKDTMNRFRLTGPLSQNVLLKALKPKVLNASSSSSSSVSTTPHWLQQLSSSDEHFQAQHAAQLKYWKSCEHLDSPIYVLPNLVLGLNVHDPRLQRPNKRTKAQPQKVESMFTDEDPNELLINTPKSISNSPLWDAEIRQKVRSNMLDTHSWCQLRQKHALVPGEKCSFEDQMQDVPVLLIQRPGQQENHMRLNYGCGWDLIVPSGYGLSFWLTFIMWGAKPGGLRESNSLAREMGREVHLPDTVAGLQAADSFYNEQREKYFKLPKAKRSNFNKLAIVSPFRAPWPQLVRDWLTLNPANRAPAYFVLRDRIQLLNLSNVQRGEQTYPTSGSLKPAENALIQLRLKMSTRGNITPNALICLPTKSDIKTFLKRRYNSSNEPIHLEPSPPDLNQNERKTARLEHKKELKRLRRKRYRLKKKEQETSTIPVRIQPAETATLIAKQALKMENLWLPKESCETLFTVRKQCSREVLGYINTSGFSYTNGTVCAVGYVPSNALKTLLNFCQKLKLKQSLCLVRDINSPQYYFSTFDVPIDP